MKKLLWLLPIAFILSACPFESKVPISYAPVEPVDSSLFGYWYGIVKDGSDFFGIEALEITQKSDSVYFITRFGKAAKGDIILPDTTYFTGFTSYIGEQLFMNIESSITTLQTRRKKPSIEVIEKIYYIANFERRHDTLSMKTIAESFPHPFPGFRTPEDLKQAIVSFTEQKKNFYDDLYALSYKKIQKPQPLKSF
ncbi:MAG: hypothetical protein ABIU11_00550 [Chitinophagaceae bacterium]